MARLDLTELWDKQDEKSIELNNLANLVFGEDYHQIILGNYVFAFSDEIKEENKEIIAKIKRREPKRRTGKIYSSEGIVFDDDYCLVYPLVKLSKLKEVAFGIVGYVLISANNYYNLITDHFFKLRNPINKEYSTGNLLKLLEESKGEHVTIITSDGELTDGYIKEQKVTFYGAELELVYKNQVYTSSVLFSNEDKIVNVFTNSCNDGDAK